MKIYRIERGAWKWSALGWAAAGLLLLAALAAAASALGQSNRRLLMKVSAPLNRTASGVLEGQPGGEVVREIDDPHNGDRWLLFRDNENPGGPGRLVRVQAGFAGRYLTADAAVVPRRLEVTPAEVSGGVPVASGPAAGIPDAPLPVIRTGDHLMLEENTAVVEAHLEAVAMGPALAGSPFSVRLKIGGKVVRAVALGPGRAAFLADTEAR